MFPSRPRFPLGLRRLSKTSSRSGKYWTRKQSRQVNFQSRSIRLRSGESSGTVVNRGRICPHSPTPGSMPPGMIIVGIAGDDSDPPEPRSTAAIKGFLKDREAGAIDFSFSRWEKSVPSRSPTLPKKPALLQVGKCSNTGSSVSGRNHICSIEPCG